MSSNKQNGIFSENAAEEKINDKSDREYKDSVIRLLFRDKKRAIELCNAVADKNYPMDAKVINCNMDNALLKRYGDVAFAIEGELFLMFEHQSTPSKNMALRCLQYGTDIIIAKFATQKALLRETLLKIPTPKFYLLYNGEKPMPEVMRLSDAFTTYDEQPSLEVIINVVNINHGSGSKALKKSPSLDGYAYLIALIRQKMNEGLERGKAIAVSIEQCIKEGIIAEFLKENYGEVVEMLKYEYTLEDELEAREMDGKEKMAVETAIEMLNDGISVEKVAKYIKKPIKWVEELMAAKH